MPELELNEDGTPKNPAPKNNPTPNDSGAEALKNQIKDLKEQIEEKDKELTHAKNEVGRIDNIRNEVIDEKRDIQAKLKALQEIYEGFTPEEVEAALKSYKAGDAEIEQQVRDIVKSRVNTYKEETIQPLEADNASLRQKIEVLRGKLSKSLVDKEILENAKEHGVKDDMLKYIAYEFQGRVDVNLNGDKVYRNSEGHEVESLNWEHEMVKLKDRSPTLFHANKGSTAVSNTGVDSIAKGDNPWISGNLSKQAMITSSDKERAAKLKAEATAFKLKKRA